jgi:Ni/Co efflux regulator RcnB
MKKILFLLTAAAIVCSPLLVTSAQAGQGKKHKAHKAQKAHHHAKHHAKHHKHA